MDTSSANNTNHKCITEMIDAINAYGILEKCKSDLRYIQSIYMADMDGILILNKYDKQYRQAKIEYDVAFENFKNCLM